MVDERAGMIASYREAFHVSGHDPIGSRPTQARSEARQWWDHARRALTATKPHSPVSRASDDQLAAWIDSADQAQRTRPEPARLEETIKRKEKSWPSWLTPGPAATASQAENQPQTR